jgi:hypothetical protein
LKAPSGFNPWKYKVISCFESTQSLLLLNASCTATAWAEAKEASKKRVSEARKRVAALGADANARADYVRRTQGRLAGARAASDDWAAEVQRRMAAVRGREATAAKALAAALGGAPVQLSS